VAVNASAQSAASVRETAHKAFGFAGSKSDETAVKTMAASEAYGKQRKAGVNSVNVSSTTLACKGHTVYV